VVVIFFLSRLDSACHSKAKSSVLSELSGLENVLFNDFIDDEPNSEDVSEQRASASLPDSVPIESEEERAAREADEMAALDAVGDYEADPNVMLEDVPQDIVIKTLKGRHIAHKFESGWEVGVIKAFHKKGPHAGKFSVKYKDDPNWWTHSLLREGYGKDKHWVLLGLPSRDFA
jgi:hypothetical protein